MAASSPTILQFGTGVFLLGFVDWIVQQLNERGDFDGRIVALKARPGSSAALAPLNRHGGQFEIWLRGYRDGELVDEVQAVNCLQGAINPFADYAAALDLAASRDWRWVISNTTEAGIRYVAQLAPEEATPETFPALLTAMLYHRFSHFDGATERGVNVLCCELIEDNATTLQQILLRHAADWHLPVSFTEWLASACHFCNTLVDRIVTGEPADVPARRTLPADAPLLEAEAFYSWVIEAPTSVQRLLPARAAGLDGLQFVANLAPWRERKVRILNGAHTAGFALSLMLEVPTVFDSMQHPLLRRYLERLVYDEICPNLSGDDIAGYAAAILERFDNPHVEHRWENIALNALSKWRARLLPSLLAALAARGSPPPLLLLSLAALLCFYRGQWQGRVLPVRDDLAAVAECQRLWQSSGEVSGAVAAIIDSELIWDGCLQAVPGLAEALAAIIVQLERDGLESTLATCLDD
ncbi:tagaturonate reductase [Parahaliea aestuarii]|uniref:Tagaturonate reductase n=1 Tax=Parahaliea aestuarii TaxID=1852021 RepID=A0A5C8ZTE5_9GAMM|nr:tagaturonate reductase [Parahaliea aestuarii]TXS91726.1 tagaturonate reductase [Parahaliea aestuarii]